MIVKGINIKNSTYYFFDDIINRKNFDPDDMKVNGSHTKILLFTMLDILGLRPKNLWCKLFGSYFRESK